MIVFRITAVKYANDLSGRGAEKAGGRWNQRGYPVLYTCQSRALAAMELAVHITLSTIQKDYQILTIEIPETPVYIFPEDQLPQNWDQFPFPQSTQLIGTRWLSAEAYLIMKVPSVVIEGDYNFLINPLHPSFRDIRIVDSKVFEFDTRLRQT